MPVATEIPVFTVMLTRPTDPIENKKMINVIVSDTPGDNICTHKDPT